MANRDLDYHGKVITVRSEDPGDSLVVGQTIIDCQGGIEDSHRGIWVPLLRRFKLCYKWYNNFVVVMPTEVERLVVYCSSPRDKQLHFHRQCCVLVMVVVVVVVG